MGYLTVKQMVGYIEDRDIMTSIDVDPYIVTSDNLFDKKSQMVLFPIK